MEKSQQAFRTISEVSEELGVPQHVLRFWETKFSSVRPMKRAGGRRYYRPEDMDLLVRIRDLLYKDGLTIKGVQKLIKDHGLKTVVSGGADAASIVEGPASISSGRGSPEAVDPAVAHSKSINTDSLRHIREKLVSIRNDARRHAS